MLANKSKLANAVIEFEKPLQFNGINSVTDVSVLTSSRITIHIETKAGNEFFTFVNTDGSNFSKQAYNMLIGTEVKNVKVALNDNVRATLFTEAILVREKKRIIAAWTNWEDGKILKDPVIQERFKVYFKEKSIPTEAELKILLEKDNEWFFGMFKNNLE